VILFPSLSPSKSYPFYAVEPLPTGTPAPAAKYFTQAQFDALDALWQQFSTAVGAPASARSNRKALTGQLPDDCPRRRSPILLVRRFLFQFAMASDLGRQFSDAWFAARQVIDLGRRAAKANSRAAKSLIILREEFPCLTKQKPM
jgi:hypothetical protein